MLSIGIKYCGGCNARYDRVKKVQELKNLFPNLFFTPAVSEESYDLVIVVCGCPAACADHVHIQAVYKKIIIDREQDYDQLHRFLDTLSLPAVEENAPCP